MTGKQIGVRFLTLKQLLELSRMLARLQVQSKMITEKGWQSWSLDKQSVLMHIEATSNAVEQLIIRNRGLNG